MTVPTTTSLVTYQGNGVTTTFTFPFIGDSDLTLEVIYTDVDGAITTLPPSSYTLVINATATGAIWGVGGSVTYPNSGSPVVPIPVGSYITINRIVPYEQNVSISNQGAFYPQAIEQGLDLLEMQIQQIETNEEYAIKAPVSDVTPPSDLPSAIVRANNYLYFDSQGNPTISAGVPTSTDVIGPASNLVFLSGQSSLSVADGLAASKGGTLVIDMNWTMVSNQTLNAPTVLFTGGVITLGVYNLTFTKNSIIAGAVTLFNQNSSGVVNGTIKGTICVDWWGTTSVSIADAATTNAGNHCLTYVAQSDIATATVVFLKSKYYLSGTITKPLGPTCPVLLGNGTQISYGGSAATAAFQIIGQAGLPQGGISGFDINGTSLNWGIEVQGQSGIQIDKCQFTTLAWGIVLHNKTTGQFTEYVQWSNCSFGQTCIQAWWYKITSGNTSFHGSGPQDGVVISDPPASALSNIVIDAAATVYNSPCNFQIWTRNTKTLISIGAGAYFLVAGTITIEVFSGTPTITGGAGTYSVIVGGIQIWAGFIKYGTLVEMDEMGILAGSIKGFLKRRSADPVVLGAGGGTVTLPVQGGNASEGYLLYVQLSGTNYSYVHQVLLGSDGGGNNGATILATPVAVNTAGYGASTFSWNGNQTLTITNAGFPGATITATVSYLDINGGA